MSATPRDEQMVTRRETAALLATSESTVKRLEKRGHFTPHRLGQRMVRYPLKEVQAYLHLVKAPPDKPGDEDPSDA